MTDNQRVYPRDPRTGKFAKIDIEQDVIAPGLGVPDEYAYDLEPRHGPAADDLAQGGQQRRLEPRSATLVADDAEARATTKYGVQGRLGRLAARLHGKSDDPISYLVGADDGRS